MQSRCSIKQAVHLNFTESVHAHSVAPLWGFGLWKFKKCTILFFGCTCTWMCFSSHQCFLGPEHRWCEDPIGIAPLFHLTLLFYYLVPRVTVDKVFCLLSSAHTYSPGAWAEWRFVACLYLFLASLFHSSKTTHYVWVSQKAFSCPEYTEPKHLGYKIRLILPKYLSVAWENDGEMLFCRTTIVEVTLISAGKRLKLKQHDTFTLFLVTLHWFTV